MSNDTVTALNNALDDTARDVKNKEAEVVRSQAIVDRLQTALNEHEAQEQQAKAALRIVGDEVDALLRLPESSTSQALIQRIDTLRSDHARAFHTYQSIHDVVRDRRQELEEAKLNLAIARQACEENQKQYQDLQRLLQRESNKQ